MTSIFLRETEGRCTQAHRRQHGDRGRAHNDTATSPAALRMPGSHQSWTQQERVSPRASRYSPVLLTPWFWMCDCYSCERVSLAMKNGNLQHSSTGKQVQLPTEVGWNTFGKDRKWKWVQGMRERDILVGIFFWLLKTCYCFFSQTVTYIVYVYIYMYIHTHNFVRSYTVSTLECLFIILTSNIWLVSSHIYSVLLFIFVLRTSTQKCVIKYLLWEPFLPSNS